ncbi:MAG TPA: chromophore lyase CpcT/CpeT [Ignavibacteriaceae bacterium]|nr:chromophore lyase CpcT/CpeT [Ignavibacteriaceae bacterium]
MIIKKEIIFVAAIWFLSTSSLAQNKKDLEILTDWMCGSFNSEEQSLQDSAYYNISLEMHRIWEYRSDGFWIYVEQAVAETKDKPYRQRIYQIIEFDGNFKSIIYSIPNEENYAVGYKDISKFSTLTPSQHEIREGCEVIIKRKDENTFIGSTTDDNCLSTLRRAVYATTKVVITENSMMSWDQGFNSKDEQVWGAVKGGYIFKK